MPQKGQILSIDKQKFLNSYPVPRLSNEFFLMSEIQKIIADARKICQPKNARIKSRKKMTKITIINDNTEYPNLLYCF